MKTKVFVVSGGGRGLGLQIVKHFLNLGHTVCTFSRERSASIRSIEEDPKTKDRFIFQIADVSERKQVTDFAREVWERFGRLDTLINNAAIARDGVLATMSFRDIEDQIKVNVLGTLYLTRACLRLMLLDHNIDKRIINITSVGGLRGFRGLVVYSATKAAIDGMTRSLARELGEKKFNVNSIAAGYLDTDMTKSLARDQLDQITRRTPMGRLGSVSDILPMIEFLDSSNARFITGQTYVIDGGLTA